jgi:hypothetical protein
MEILNLEKNLFIFILERRIFPSYINEKFCPLIKYYINK